MRRLQLRLARAIVGSNARRHYLTIKAGKPIGPHSYPCTSRRFSSNRSPCFFRRNSWLRSYSECCQGISKFDLRVRSIISQSIIFNTSFTTTAARQGYQERDRRILGGFVERAALLRLRRNTGFATGFSPLKPKPLDSIMDVE